MEVTEAGIQRVSYAALKSAGLYLTGVRHDAIAVTWRDEPVAYWIGGGDERFGPGHWIQFVGHPPAEDDALYIYANQYQVAVNPDKARQTDCMSFIPLPTGRVGVTIYSLSQNRLVDLDGDGVGDKAIGQFSVRDESELATVVEKGSYWRNSVAGLQSALLVAEGSDGKHDFLAQVERLRDRIDWSGTEVLDLTEHKEIGAARRSFTTALESGQALTMFSGHSSPSVRGFRSLLTAGTARSLGNSGLPTMMVPLACETTYDISPNANTLGHQLMYAGNRGALAISGAVSLSTLRDNERMANYIVDGLNSGMTLREAVQSGRDALGPGFRMLHDNWVNQGDVTARLSK